MPRSLRVLRTTQVTPRMRRITLGGAQLAGFGGERQGPNVKALLPHAAHGSLVLPAL